MKKLLALLLALSVCFVCFGCSKEKDDEKADDNKKTAVAEDTEKESSADKTTEAEDGEEKTTVANDDTRNEETKYDSLEALVNSDEMQAAFKDTDDEEFSLNMTAVGYTVYVNMTLKVDITDEQREEMRTQFNDANLGEEFGLSELYDMFDQFGFSDAQIVVVVKDNVGNTLAEQDVDR